MSDPETLAFCAAQTTACRKRADGSENPRPAAMMATLPPGAGVLARTPDPLVSVTAHV